MGKKTTAVEQEAGHFQSIVNSLMKPVNDGRVPYEAVRRLTTAAGQETVTRMIEDMVEGWLATQQRPMIEGQTQVVAVPDKSAAELIADAERAIGLTYLNPALRSTYFIVDERGKTYEIAVWKPSCRVSSEDVRKHFRDLCPSRPYLGNTAAFVVWVTKKQPQGCHVSIPEESRLLRHANGHLCAPLFHRDGAYRGLGLGGVADVWDDACVFVAFREVSV